MDIEFTINGTRRRLAADDVCAKVRGTTPGAIRIHAVRIDGVDYPVKEAFALTTGLDLLDFTTNQARAVLKRLGFDVYRTV